MTPEELRKALLSRGWHVEESSGRTGVPWYAWRRLSDVADCTSNEKAPSFILKPWQHEEEWSSVEFQLCGEAGDVWLQLKAYSIPMDDALSMWPRCEELLKAAWNAAARLPRESVQSTSADSGNPSGRVESSIPAEL